MGWDDLRREDMGEGWKVRSGKEGTSWRGPLALSSSESPAVTFEICVSTHRDQSHRGTICQNPSGNQAESDANALVLRPIVLQSFPYP